MRTFSTWIYAVASGAALEGALWGSLAMFGGFGPCGPTNDFSGFFLTVHSPGFWFAETIFPSSGWLAGSLAITFTAAVFSVGFALVFNALKALARIRKSRASNAPKL